MIKNETLSRLKSSKNLLAFSAGVDSSALFYLLLEHHIKFDIAIVHYNLRDEAKEEFIYAQKLAKKHHLTCHSLDVELSNANMEMQAREVRYGFFNKLIKQHNYTSLLTAHQLNDKLEWFLMQFSKGSSLSQMLGMQEIESRENFMLIRPLLHVERSALYEYLHVNNFHYFEDSSNADTSYKRNLFRQNISNFLMDNFKEGIAKSFTYLQEESDSLFKEEPYQKIKKLYYFKSYNNRLSTIKMIDILLKKEAILLHAGDRNRLKEENALVIARKVVVCISENFVFIAPHVNDIVMEKKFKEQCRVLKICTLLRGYLFQEPEVRAEVFELLESQ